MRKEQISETLEVMPSKVADFDLSGIASGLNMIGGMGLLGGFVGAFTASPLDAKTTFTHVWNMTPAQLGALNDATKFGMAFNSALGGGLMPNASLPQVIAAVTNFWHKLFG